MASYYNPYNYPAVAGGASFAPYSQQPLMPQAPMNVSMTPPVRPIEWVDGEAAAKAYQMPPGWAPDTPIALWDNTAPFIYFKSWNRMGMPSQLQKIQYDPTPIQADQTMMTAGNFIGQSGQNQNTSGNEAEKNYATKDDLMQMKNDIQEMLKSITRTQNTSGNQNGSNNTNGNRGGNRAG